MNNIPKISIITVSYNAADTIEQTISSVVNQTYENIEYIIIDGGSTDGTVDIIRKYEDRIAYWVSEPDKGIYDAMNKGIDVATGYYIYFLGADDAILNINTFSGIADDILSSYADFYSYGIYVVNNKCRQKYYGNSHARGKKDVVDMVPHQGVIIKTKIMKKYRFDTKYRIAADYKLFLQCYSNKNYTKVYQDKPVAFFAYDGISSNSINLIQSEHEQICKELGFRYSRVYTDGTKFFLKKILGWLKLLTIIRYVRKRIGWKKHMCSNGVCRWCGRG